MEWHHKGPRTIQDLLNLSSKGIKNDYLAPDCFTQLCSETDLDINQAEIQKLRDELSDCRIQIQLSGSVQTTTNGECVSLSRMSTYVLLLTGGRVGSGDPWSGGGRVKWFMVQDGRGFQAPPDHGLMIHTPTINC